MATWIPEQSTIQGKLPFSAFFNIGNGERYVYKGKKTAGSWYNMSNQDLVPTYRWLVYRSETTNVSNAIDAQFTNTDAYMGGSCLQVKGTKTDGNADLILYKTLLEGNGGNIVAKLAVMDAVLNRPLSIYGLPMKGFYSMCRMKTVIARRLPSWASNLLL